MLKRYTTRRGQGYSQSKSDNAKGASYSAGAALRRHNELALIEEVGVLLRLGGMKYIVAMPYSGLTLISHVNACLQMGFANSSGMIPRLRTIPFTTRKTKFGGNEEMHWLLFTVEMGHFEQGARKAWPLVCKPINRLIFYNPCNSPAHLWSPMSLPSTFTIQFQSEDGATVGPPTRVPRDIKADGLERTLRLILNLPENDRSRHTFCAINK